MVFLEDKVEEILAEVLESVPGKSAGEVYPKLQKLVEAGAEAIGNLADLLLEDGHGDDSRVRFAVHGLAVFVGNDAKYRKIFAEGVARELETAAPDSVKMFLMQQLLVAGAGEGIGAIEKLKNDPQLGVEASRILSGLGQVR